jgi:mRNA-degrading endonuclease RelE of RelBE toxin-antitoxin system
LSTGEAAALSTEKRFHEEFIDLPKDAQKRVVRALVEMQHDLTHRSKQLAGMPGIWRREVAPYRILFATGPGWIHVYSVQHRQGVYTGRIARPLAAPRQTRPPMPALTIGAEPSDAEKAAEDWASSDGKDRATAYAWDLVERIVACESPEDLYGLIDLGLPDDLFDKLNAELEGKWERNVSEAGNVRLIRRYVIDAFFGPLIKQTEANKPLGLLVITPWITPWDGPTSSFKGFIEYLRHYRIRTTIVTRPAELSSHKRAMKELAKLDQAEIIELADLHAKFFVCDIAPAPFALVASANSTAQSYSNFEVGIFIRGSGRAEGLIRDLQGLAVDLLAAGQRVKRRGAA